jgi:uncharacterized protein (DUF58 family)
VELPIEIIRQIRRLHLRARRAVEDILGGEYHSVFKGAGLSFEEVREYQPGDDVRSIDWNVTARMGQPFIKRYVEEREQTVLLLTDLSASLRFGTAALPKRAVTAELVSLLSFCAIANNDRVGLLAFTDRVEQFLPPLKGARHALRLIRDILFHPARGQGTSIANAIDYLNRLRRRRSIVFLISDFLDTGYIRPLRLLASRHDLIAVRVSDPAERAIAAAGLVWFADAETGRQRLVDTSSRVAVETMKIEFQSHHADLERLARAGTIDLIDVTTTGNHVDALIRFFQRRERQAQRHFR